MTVYFCSDHMPIGIVEGQGVVLSTRKACSDCLSEAYDKYRTQLERGIITPDDYAMRCAQDLALAQAEKDRLGD